MVAQTRAHARSNAPVSGVSPTPPPRSRAGSWHLSAPDGAYSQLLAWDSGEAWFDALMDALRTLHGEQLRRRRKVSADTLLRVAYADRMSADHRTGRDVTTAHETVAKQLGMSSKTVQRSRDLLTDLGFAVTVVPGRRLTSLERLAARRAHGQRQINAASTRALVMPRPEPSTDRAQTVENVHLPLRRRVNEKSRQRRWFLKRAKRAKPTPTPLPAQKFAAELLRQDPSLLKSGQHIGALCRLVQDNLIVERGWTPRSLLSAINDLLSTRGGRPEPRNPLGYFAWCLTHVLPDGLSPDLAAAEERNSRAARQLEAQRADADKRARIQTEQADIDAILAEMRRAYPRR